MDTFIKGYASVIQMLLDSMNYIHVNWGFKSASDTLVVVALSYAVLVVIISIWAANKRTFNSIVAAIIMIGGLYVLSTVTEQFADQFETCKMIDGYVDDKKAVFEMCKQRTTPTGEWSEWQARDFYLVSGIKG